MVSKKRMYMGLPVQNAGPDIAVLFLGMKLITTHATDITDGGLYATAKNFLAVLEKNGTVSLATLQAMILVALYEYGHGIFPAAWMTVGACARYSEILGLPQGETSVLGPPVSETLLSLGIAGRVSDVNWPWLDDLDRSRGEAKGMVEYLHPRQDSLHGKQKTLRNAESAV